jgi:hypothetical protein
VFSTTIQLITGSVKGIVGPIWRSVSPGMDNETGRHYWPPGAPETGVSVPELASGFSERRLPEKGYDVRPYSVDVSSVGMDN